MRFVKESLIRASQERLFAFHEQPEALVMLMPPWEKSRIINRANISEVGSRTEIEARILGPFSIRWIAEHTQYQPPEFFEDVQIKGPFRSWRHRHIARPAPDGAILRDEIDYEPPLGFLGRWFGPTLIESRLQRLFDYRHKVTAAWCENELQKRE
jgi:ligand-binding SRPBCC domain-containing protein